MLNKNGFVKILSVVCATVIMLCCLYVPVLVNVNAANLTPQNVKTFGFGEAEGKAEFLQVNVLKLTEKDGRTALTNKPAGGTSSAAGIMLVNDGTNAYTLTPMHTYKVDITYNFVSSIASDKGIKDEAAASFYLSYGSLSSVTNFTAIATTTKASKFFTSEQLTGKKTYPVGDVWRKVTYVFTMPKVKEGAATNLAIRYFGYKGVSCFIDELTVEDYGEGCDYIAATNVLTDEDVYYVGSVGETPVLADLEKFGKRNFKGWYIDAKGETPADNVTFGDGTHTVFGMFDGATEITVHDSVNGDTVVSGQQDDSLTDALNNLNPKEFDGGKKFIGYYTDESFTEKLTAETFGVANYEIYALYSDKVTLTFNDTLNGTKTKAEGYPREALALPDLRDGTHAPDDVNAQLFTGWYTEKDLLNLFDTNEFPVTDKELYSKWDTKADDIIQDFENYVNPGSNGIKNFTVKADIGVSDSKAAYLSGTDVSSYILVTNEDLKKKLISKGKLYKLSYSYKVKTDAVMSLQIVESSSLNNYWENPNVMSSHEIEFLPGADTGWVTYESYFMANDYIRDGSAASYTPKALYIRANNPDGGNIEVTVDNFKLEAVSPTSTLISFVCLNDDEYGTEGDVYNDINIIDTPIVFPNVTYGERKLLGWSLVKNGEELYTGTLHGKQNITLYAVWDTSSDPTVETFEKYTSKSGYAPDMFAVTTEKAYRGNKSMKFTFDSEIAAAHSGTLSSISLSMLGVQLKNSTTYKLSFRYYIETADTNVTLKPATSTAGNIWDDRKNVNYLGGVLISKDDKKGEWLEGATLITTDFVGKENANGVMTYGDWLHLYASIDSINTVVFYLDDLTLTPIVGDNAAILFDDNAGGAGAFFTGKIGDTIKYPENPVVFGKEFDFWANEADGKTRFTDTVLSEGIKTVYAKYNQAEHVVFDLENYSLANYYPKEFLNVYEPQSIYDGASLLSGKTADKSIPAQYRTVSSAQTDARYVERDFALSGNHVMEINRDANKSPTGVVNTGPRFFLADGAKPFVIDVNYNYVMKLNYYITVPGNNNAKVYAIIADSKNIWSKGTAGDAKNRYTIYTNEELNVWHTAYVPLDFDVNTGKLDINRLAFGIIMSGGTNGDYFFDDIELIRIPKDKTAIVINNNGCSEIPNYVLTTAGTDFKSLLPQNPKLSGKLFRGYTLNSLAVEDWKAPQFGLFLETHWIATSVTQGFEDNYTKYYSTYSNYSVMDFDYELYDGNASGNSKDNVASGRYSLHRKGESMFFENACLLNSGSLSSTDRYKVTMKIKMGKYLQTDGAVKVVSCKSSIYPWDTSGSYYAVAAIKDLTDGKWHEVSYVFNSVEAYAALQTPGYCELFIDDVKFEYVGDGEEVSLPPVYDEYVPMERDADGNIIGNVKENTFDVSKIIDDSLCAAQNGKNINVWLVVIIAAVVILGGGVSALLILKKKKTNKA